MFLCFFSLQLIMFLQKLLSKKLKGQYLDKQYQNASALSCDKYFLVFVVRKKVLHQPCSLNFHQVK